MIQSDDTTWTLNAIGTRWHIDTERALSDDEKAEVLACIVEYDRVFSRFLEGSLIDRIHHAAGTYPFPPYANELFDLYAQLYEITNGMFTPLVGQILDDLGYDAAYGLKQKKNPTAPYDWPEVARYIDQRLTTTTPLLIDVGAAGKGHIVDLVANVLIRHGHTHYVVDAGSDMKISRTPDEPLRIGLEHPLDTNQVIGMIELADKSLCGSSVNRRSWGAGLHHVINPKTAAPTSDVIATWVIADSTMIADGLATALFLCEPHVLQKHFEFDYVRVNQAMQIDYSTAFTHALF